MRVPRNLTEIETAHGLGATGPATKHLGVAGLRTTRHKSELGWKRQDCVYFDWRLEGREWEPSQRKIVAFLAGSRKSKRPIDVTIPSKLKANSITMMGSRK
jgi:hypothetical protein